MNFGYKNFFEHSKEDIMADLNEAYNGFRTKNSSEVRNITVEIDP